MPEWKCWHCGNLSRLVVTILPRGRWRKIMRMPENSGFSAENDALGVICSRYAIL